VTTTLCPNGHASDDADYCSVCGARIGGAGSAADPAAVVPGSAAPSDPSAAGDTCPSCGAARTDRAARYCEVCRYDYEARQPGPPPVTATPAAPAPAADPGADPAAAPGADPGADPAADPAPGPPADPATALPAAPAAAGWEVTVEVDPSLDVDPDPATPAPTDAASRVFPVDLAEMLVGRRDDRHDIRPEIPLQDPAVSRRHAKLFRGADGGLAILDLASANGTAINGVQIPAGERRPVADGDVITLGRWTKLTARRA
jgi:hypothetical protein